MRRGITPVIAIILLLMMTVAAAGSAYAWMQQVQSEAQQDADTALAASIDIKDATCRNHRIELAVKNGGDRDIVSDTADIRVYQDGSLVNTTEASLTGTGVATAGGFGTVGGNLSGLLAVNEHYRVELSIPSPSLEASTSCESVAAPTCNHLLQSGLVSSDGTYDIDPDGVGGAAAFPVRCEMDANGGGWTRLNFLPDSHTGAKGAPFGDSDRSPSFGSTDRSQGNLGLVDSRHDPVTSDAAFFQRDSNMRCTRYAIGNATGDTYLGVSTGWDYYDADGNPIPPGQVRALNTTVVDGTYYTGNVSLDDIDGPFPDGPDGDGGTNSFSIAIDPSATHSPTGGGPIVLWFSTTPDMDAGTTHALGSDYDSTEGNPNYHVSWKPVNTMGVPMFFGGKVDNNQNLYSTFDNGCEQQSGSEFELENQHFYAR